MAGEGEGEGKGNGKNDEDEDNCFWGWRSSSHYPDLTLAIRFD